MPSPSRSSSSLRLWLGIAAVAVAAAVVAVVLLVVVRPDRSGYDDATRQRFLEACTADGGEAVAVTCGCLYDALVDSLPYERFEEVDRALLDQPAEPGIPLTLPADVQALLDECRSQVGPS